MDEQAKHNMTLDQFVKDMNIPTLKEARRAGAAAMIMFGLPDGTYKEYHSEEICYLAYAIRQPGKRMPEIHKLAVGKEKTPTHYNLRGLPRIIDDFRKQGVFEIKDLEGRRLNLNDYVIERFRRAHPDADVLDWYGRIATIHVVSSKVEEVSVVYARPLKGRNNIEEIKKHYPAPIETVANKTLLKRKPIRYYEGNN
jgi:uncharacterized protein YlzI (FlbEa/FlbD family)